MALLLIVLKVALIAFVFGGTAALVARGVRRSRANRSDPRWTSPRIQPGYEASAFGAMPTTPLPEWAYWDERGNDGEDAKRS